MHNLKQIPNSENIVFKEKFVEQYSLLTDWELFKKYSLSFLRKSIRINTLKIDIASCIGRLKDRFFLEQIPWCKEGFWINHKEGRLDVGNSIEHALGYYYVQESASMIPPIVLDPQINECVLDCCAAPGSKTSQIAQYMNNTGIVVANDIVGSRLAALGINLQRIGVSNAVLTHSKAQNIKNILFDKILVDAPCSGTGTIRKSLKTINQWSPGIVKHLSNIQKNILANSWNLLNKEGVLVYSTCTLEPLENEGVIDWMLNNFDNVKIEKIGLNINTSPAVLSFDKKEFSSEIKNCLRIWPQDNDTEGFFVAKLQKI